MKYFRLLALLMLPLPLFAQEPQTPEQQRKEVETKIQEMVDKYEVTLNLEYWQVFYADSVLMHDYFSMYDELQEASKKKVSNTQIYEDIKDKWSEATYNAFHSFLTEEQWELYLKQGAFREKKARDKRAEKRKNKI